MIEDVVGGAASDFGEQGRDAGVVETAAAADVYGDTGESGGHVAGCVGAVEDRAKAFPVIGSEGAHGRRSVTEGVDTDSGRQVRRTLLRPAVLLLRHALHPDPPCAPSGAAHSASLGEGVPLAADGAACVRRYGRCMKESEVRQRVVGVLTEALLRHQALLAGEAPDSSVSVELLDGVLPHLRLRLPDTPENRQYADDLSRDLSEGLTQFARAFTNAFLRLAAAHDGGVTERSSLEILQEMALDVAREQGRD